MGTSSVRQRPPHNHSDTRSQRIFGPKVSRTSAFLFLTGSRPAVHRQKGPDGEKVVSARAIKHTRELTAIAKGERVLESGEPLRSAILFVVNRADATLFRPNEEACASVARYVKEAQAAGVKVLAWKVRWGEGADLGRAFCDGALYVKL